MRSNLIKVVAGLFVASVFSLTGCGGGGGDGGASVPDTSSAALVPVTQSVQGTYVLTELRRDSVSSSPTLGAYTSYDDVTTTPALNATKVYGSLKMGSTSMTLLVNFVDGSTTNVQGTYILSPINSTMGNFVINNTTTGTLIDSGAYSLTAPNTLKFTVSPYVITIPGTFGSTTSTTKTYTFVKSSNAF